jgi:hypothetical protein
MPYPARIGLQPGLRPDETYRTDAETEAAITRQNVATMKAQGDYPSYIARVLRLPRSTVDAILAELAEAEGQEDQH